MKLARRVVPRAISSDTAALTDEPPVAENLHRNELTALERDEHNPEWIKLTEKKQKEEVSVELD
jgi:hypothetical protein